MHPIERLRYVARAGGAAQTLLVRETAQALATFRADPQGLVTACRRTVERHPGAGALWTLCTRILLGDDPMVEAWSYADAVEADATPRELAHALADDAVVVVLGWPELLSAGLARRGDVTTLVVDVHDEGTGFVHRLLAGDGAAADVPITGLGAAVAEADLVLLEASAMGPEKFLGVSGSLPAAAVARQLEVPVWLVVGEGRAVAADTWNSIVELSNRRRGAVESWHDDEETMSLDLVDRIVGPTGVSSVAGYLQSVERLVAPELFGPRDT